MGKLFPLDCGWRFGGDVVDHAVHSPHFVDDFVAYGTQEVVGEMAPGGGHAVCGVYGAESYHVLVGALVAHDSYGAYGQQDGSCLPYLVVEAIVP